MRHCIECNIVCLPEIIDGGAESLGQTMTNEIERLQNLQAKNPSIRDEEIAHLQQTAAEGLAHIQHASLQLQGIRVVVNT